MKLSIRHRFTSILIASAILSCCLSTWAGTPGIGDAAPNIKMHDIQGRTFNLSDYKGKKPVYVKFWATWCHYCLSEMPHLQHLVSTYGDEVEMVTINVGLNDSIANINQLYKRQNFSPRTLFDQKGSLSKAYGIIGTPQHLLIDRNGHIAYRSFLATDQLDQLIAQWASEETSTNQKRD